jgi:hypothetical protein
VPAADNAERGGSTASTETRADRIRRRIANNKLGALVIVAVGLISAVGGTIGGVRQVVGLFDSPSKTPVTESAVRLNPSELRTAKNERYGFSFQYPVTWQRADPVNGDGLTAIGPEPGLQLLAYGRSPTFGPSADDVYSRLDYQVRQLAEGKRIVEEPNQQNVTRFLPGGDTTEASGLRFVMATDALGESPGTTTVALATTTRERDVELLCTVPTRLFARWRGACNQLLSGLTLTR